jgi:hypothetical protein
MGFGMRAVARFTTTRLANMHLLSYGMAAVLTSGTRASASNVDGSTVVVAS